MIAKNYWLTLDLVARLRPFRLIIKKILRNDLISKKFMNYTFNHCKDKS